MLRSILSAAVIALATPALAASGQAEPVKFAVTDIEGLETLQQEFAAFQQVLHRPRGAVAGGPAVDDQLLPLRP